MKAEIISVGNELLSGATVNTNTAFLSRELAMLGFDVHRQQVVGDGEDDIIDALALAIKRSSVILFTGGLGPTEDDLTKETVAKALNMRLVEDADVLEDIQSFFRDRGIEMTQNNYKQAQVIKGCEILWNYNGTAPGLYLQSRSQVIALLPGPPSELEPMFQNELAPLLRRFSGRFSARRSLHVFGIGESALEEKVHDILYGDNPSSALYAKTGQVHIDIHAEAASEEEAHRLLDERVAQYRERLGDVVYSDNGDDLHEAVVHSLAAHGMSVSVAESCTGGLMASRITSVPGSSDVFQYGITSYADWVKKQDLKVDAALLRRFTAISSVAAAEMAKGARKQGNSTLGVGITGIAGPSSGPYLDKPVGLVYIAVADKSRVVVKQFNFGDRRNRNYIREVSVLNAFDMVRRLAFGLPIANAHTFDLKTIADIDNPGEPKRLSSLAAKRVVTGVLCGAVLLTSAGLGVDTLRRKLDTNIYNELKSVFLTSDNDYSFDELLSRNPDTVGWLTVNSTFIDSVVVQDKGDGYYSTHDFAGAQNTLGCLYTDVQTGADNTVIYGSSNESNQMFGPLLQYTDLGFLAENSLITYRSPAGASDYRIFSVFYANANADQGFVQEFYRATDFTDETAFQNFVIECKMRSLFHVDVPLNADDTFITLVTDTQDWDGSRLVVVGRRLREGENPTASTSLFTKNAAALYPDAWYKANGTTALTNVTAERDRWLNWLIAGTDAGASTENTATTPTPSAPENLFDGGAQITVEMNGQQITDSPLNIVSMAVAYEVGETYEDEAIKAQAIATISQLRFIAQNDVPVLNGTAASSRIRRLVSEVICLQMTYEGQPINATFFPLSAGMTNSSEEVFGADLPYLISEQSRYDSGAVGYSRTTAFPKEVLRERLENWYNITLSDDMKSWITIEQLTAGGYVRTVSIDDQVEATGLDLVACLSLRSASFSTAIDGDQMVFSTLGHGHGVGMSQGGANLYALYDGWTYEQILHHYYKNVTIESFTW